MTLISGKFAGIGMEPKKIGVIGEQIPTADERQFRRWIAKVAEIAKIGESKK